MKKLLGGLLIISVVLNGFLLQRSLEQQRALSAWQASVSEVEELRQQVNELQAKAASGSPAEGSAVTDSEVARLRNEVGQLRRQLKEAQKPAPAPRSSRDVGASANLADKFADATNELAQLESELSGVYSNDAKLMAELAQASPEQLDALKRRAQSRQCINNLKQIGLAARLWSNDHHERFPPDYLTMREELSTPKLLFCPAAGGTPPTDWAQLNPAAVSYPWQAATADESRPESVLTRCPIHGHIGHADGSVQMAPGEMPNF